MTPAERRQLVAVARQLVALSHSVAALLSQVQSILDPESASDVDAPPENNNNRVSAGDVIDDPLNPRVFGKPHTGKRATIPRRGD